MRYVQLIVLMIALNSQTTFARGRRMARPNPVMAALQNMFNGNNMPMPRNRRLPVETGMPVNRMDTPWPYMRNVEQKCPCQLKQPCPRVLPEMRMPDILTMREMVRQEVARMPEMRMPAPLIAEKPKQFVPNMPVGAVMAAPARLISEVMPTPARVIPEVIDMPVAIRNIPEVIDMPVAIRNTPEVFDMPVAIRKIPEVVNMPIIQERYECPCASPKALVNPFLPAASPVSAYAPPTSNMLPPMTPNLGRNHFLRKIPIPPPTL